MEGFGYTSISFYLVYMCHESSQNLTIVIKLFDVTGHFCGRVAKQDTKVKRHSYSGTAYSVFRSGDTGTS